MNYIYIYITLKIINMKNDEISSVAGTVYRLINVYSLCHNTCIYDISWIE